MKNVIVWELRRRRTALIWWSLGSAFLTAVILALYPSIRDQAHQLNTVINQLPPGLRGLKSGGTSSVNVGDPAQFLNSQIYYATLPIIWIILAVTRGGSILGREEQTHTLELLLARPVSRSRLLLAKAISLFLEVFIVAAVTLLVTLPIGPLFDLKLGVSKYLSATLLTALFSLSFGYIAFCLQAASSLTRRVATVTAVAVGFGGYVLASLSSLTDWLKVPAKFAPYHYFTPLDALEGRTPHGLLIYLTGALVLGSVIAFIGFRRRDIA